MDVKFIVLEICVGIVTIVASYLAVVVTWHLCHNRKQRSQTPIVQTTSGVHNGNRTDSNGDHVNSNGNHADSNGNHTNSNGVNGIVANVAVTSDHSVALGRLCVASIWLIVIRCLSEHVTLFFVFNDAGFVIACDVMLRVDMALYLAPFTTCYLFLWIRQRVVYMHPVLGHNRCSEIISWSALFILIIGEITTFSLFMVNMRYDHATTGNDNALNEGNVTRQCISSTSDVLSSFAPWVTLAVFTLSFQVLLLGLFIKPLALCGNTIRRMESAAHHVRSNPFPLLKRVFLAFGACFVSDILAFGGSLASSDVVIANAILDANILINFITLLMTYNNWKERVLPCCCTKKETPASSSSNIQIKEMSSSRSPISSVSTNVEEVFDDH